MSQPPNYSYPNYSDSNYNNANINADTSQNWSQQNYSQQTPQQQPGIFNPAASNNNAQQSQQYSSLNMGQFENMPEQQQYPNSGMGDLHQRKTSHLAANSAQTNVFQPTGAAAGTAAANLGAGMGGPVLTNPLVQSFIQQETSNFLMKYIPGIAVFYNSLKYYFNVHNNYVKRKLALLCFPFRHKNWTREYSQSNDGVAHFAPPVSDINAPDLYIPSMSFVTYVLLVGLLKGTNMTFTPEVLSDAFNSAVTTVFLEVLMMKLGMYFLAPGIGIPLLDLTAYSGYKYVGVSINMIIGLSMGVFFYNIFLLYTCACMAVFIFRTMQCVVPEPNVDESGRKRRLYLLAMMCVLQCLSIWWMGYTRDFGGSKFSFGLGGGSTVEGIVEDTTLAPDVVSNVDQTDEMLEDIGHEA